MHRQKHALCSEGLGLITGFTWSPKHCQGHRQALGGTRPSMFLINATNQKKVKQQTVDVMARWAMTASETLP